MNKKGELYCRGCGVKLQFEIQESEGYIPKSALDKADYPICQRCYNLQYHSDINGHIKIEQDYLQIFKTAANSNGLIVFVADIFNFKSSISNLISKYLAKNKFILVLNKCDVLPQSVKQEKIINWVYRRLNYNQNILNIIITSAKKSYNIDELTQNIEKYRNGRDVYFIGVTNAGKSSLINAFLRSYRNETDQLITTSFFPNTTLKIIEIPLDHHSYIYDTPGISDESSMYNFVEPAVLKQILPAKEIKPRIYQLKGQQSIYIGGLARIDIAEERKVSLVFYFSEFVTLHRTKLENNPEKFINLIKNKQLKPVSSKVNSVNDLIINQITFGKIDKCDIVIYGYGFITFRNCANMTIRILLPANIKAEVQEPLI